MSQLCTYYHFCGRSLDSWCSDYWKMHFSVKYIYAYQSKLSPRFLSSAPKQWEVIHYPETLFYRKYSPLPSRRGWGSYEKVNKFLLLSEVYSELRQTCRIELFAKILNDFEPLPTFAKLHLGNIAGLYMYFWNSCKWIHLEHLIKKLKTFYVFGTLNEKILKMFKYT